MYNERVTLPDSVTTISSTAFTLTIGAEVKYIPADLFLGCSSLTFVTILDGEGNMTIGEDAFYHATKLKTVKIGSGVVSIGARAFGYASALDYAIIGKDVNEMGANAIEAGNRTVAIYFVGSAAEYDAISKDGATIPTNAPLYLYAENAPKDEDSFRHFDTDGNPAIW